MEQPEEKRFFTRIPFQGTVHMANTHGSWDTELMDISLNGALVAKPQDWQGSSTDHYMMELDLPNSHVEIRMEVVIAHVEDDRIGLQCKHIDLDSITHLRRLVELNLGDSSSLTRQLAALG